MSSVLSVLSVEGVDAAVVAEVPPALVLVPEGPPISPPPPVPATTRTCP